MMEMCGDFLRFAFPVCRFGERERETVLVVKALNWLSEYLSEVEWRGSGLA